MFACGSLDDISIQWLDTWTRARSEPDVPHLHTYLATTFIQSATHSLAIAILPSSTV